MSDAYVCDTTFQLLNVLNIRMSLFSDEKADLFIVDQFRNAQGCFYRINESHIFDNVYLIPNYNKGKNYSDDQPRYYLSKIEELLTPQKLLQTWSKSKEMFDCYDRLFVSIFSRAQIVLRQINPVADVIFYDDGTGSYTGKVLPEHYQKHKICYRILHLGRQLLLQPDVIYLNNPEFARSSPVKVEKIPDLRSLCDEQITTINAALGMESKELDYYVNKRFVFLTQPSDGLSVVEEMTRKTKELLIDFKNDVVIRNHPRLIGQNNDDEGFCIDNSANSWELIMAQIDMNTKCLIGFFSTAQFTPKMMYDQEPFLVFLYKIANLPNADMMDKEVKTIQSHYRNKKVFVPNDFIELSEILQNMNGDDSYT